MDVLGFLQAGQVPELAADSAGVGESRACDLSCKDYLGSCSWGFFFLLGAKQGAITKKL